MGEISSSNKHSRIGILVSLCLAACSDTVSVSDSIPPGDTSKDLCSHSSCHLAACPDTVSVSDSIPPGDTSRDLCSHSSCHLVACPNTVNVSDSIPPGQTSRDLCSHSSCHLVACPDTMSVSDSIPPGGTSRDLCSHSSQSPCSMPWYSECIWFHSSWRHIQGLVQPFQLSDNQLHNPQHKGREAPQQLDGTCVTMDNLRGDWRSLAWNYTRF